MRLSKGFRLATHHHTKNEQMVCVLSDAPEFVLDEGAPTERRVMTGGQVLVLPPNAPHGCVAHEDTDILDLFSPPSEKTGVDRT